MVVEAPPLARFLPITQYAPEVGDFIIWSGWFRTWYGVVGDISPDGQELSVIWEGLPFLLFTLTGSEQKESSQMVKLEQIVSCKPGNFSVMKHDAQHNTPIWYV